MGKTVSRVSSVLFILGIWLIVCLAGSYFIFSFIFGIHSKNLTLFLASASRNVFASENIEDQVQVNSQLTASDGRVLIVNKFLSKYGSPMAGHGNAFIEAADKNGIDWRLLPAIAFQESTLGKKIPKGSYNAFGWAVYTGKNSGVRFASWSHAIQTVAKGLNKDYIQRGLKTPETIVVRYADAHENWLFGVNSAIKELSALEN